MRKCGKLVGFHFGVQVVKYRSKIMFVFLFILHASHPSSALTLTQLRIFIIPLANEFHNESDENGAARRARPLRVIHCGEKRYGIHGGQTGYHYDL